MKKAFFLITAVLFSMVVSAQIDFSGSWKLNKSKSKLGDQFSMAPKEIVVTQKGNDLGIEKHAEWDGQEFTISDKLTLDGKECINPGWMDTKKKSTADWSSDKKSLKITSKMPMQDGGEMTIIEIFNMQDINMVIETSASSSFGEFSETQVYDKN